VLLTFACVLQLLTLVWVTARRAARADVVRDSGGDLHFGLPITPNGLGVRDNLTSISEPSGDQVPAGTAVAISLVAYAGSLV
jgi:hypothetical protein